MEERVYVENIVARATGALREYADYTQEQVDKCIKAMCRAFRENARILAEEAVAETGYGDTYIKTEKNEQAADAIWYTLKNEKTVGIIGEDTEKKLIYVAKPVGVIAAITPSTNPSTTIMFNACYALKGRNAVIFSVHPAAKNTSVHTIEILIAALREAGAPINLLQYLDIESEVNLSDELLKQCSLSIVAGPAKTVNKGCASGHPSIGVSHGNVQTIVDRGSDYEKVVAETVYSCSFDNGLICACTQSLLVPEESREEFLRLFKTNGAQVITEAEEIEKVRSLLFPDNKNLDINYIGKSAGFIAAEAQLEENPPAKALLIAPEAFEDDDPFLAGEMTPVCLLLTYKAFDDALLLAKRALAKDGAGHASVIYTNDTEKAKRMALELPLTRILVNQYSIYAANQQLRNGLNPTANLACGSWANNIYSENITCRHLLNICRICWELDEKDLPGAEDIWS